MVEAGRYFLDGLTESAFLLGFLFGPLILFGFLFHVLSGWIQRLVGGGKAGIWFVWLTAPGAIVHELGHAIFCLPFGHRIERIRFFRPTTEGAMGEVVHSHCARNPWAWVGQFFIGTGPLWLGGVAIWGLGFLLLGGSWPKEMRGEDWNLADWSGVWMAIGELTAAAMDGLLRLSLWSRWPPWFFLYLAVSIGVHLTLSKPDWRDTLRGFLVLAAGVWFFLLAVRWLFPGMATWAARGIVLLIRFYAVLAFTACLTLGFALMLWGLRALFPRQNAGGEEMR